MFFGKIKTNKIKLSILQQQYFNLCPLSCVSDCIDSSSHLVNINLFLVRFSICLEQIPASPYVCWRQRIGSCKGKKGLLFILIPSSWISVDSWH